MGCPGANPGREHKTHIHKGWTMDEKPGLLVVDDDELTLEMLKATLETNYKVSTATSGIEALKRVEHESFDLILLDVEMPEVDGYETCRQLREGGATAQTPVVFLSALSSIEERLRGYAVGGDDYLTKPFDVAELLAKIERVLLQRRRQAELSAALDEVTNAVLSSADMVGEAGVVLEFQRRLAECQNYEQVAHAIFESLARYGLEGCVRLCGLGAPVTRNPRGPCTALELSIVEHLQANQHQSGARIRPLGQHTSFNYGTVIVFVRNLPMVRPETMDRGESERIGRAIDNVALLVEGALTRVAALDSVMAARDLADVKHLVVMTREALADISARNQAQVMEVRQLCDQLRADVENAFLQLGLTATQEDFLSEMLRLHASAVMTSLHRSEEAEQFLRRVINKLAQAS